MTEPEDDQQEGRQERTGPDDDRGFIERTMRALELTQGVEIARRYLAMNAFDGALTMLGLILGGLITIDPANPGIIFNALLLAAVGTSVAMAVSGFSGSYLAESAERDREVEEMGRAMLADMSESMYAKATRTTSVVVAVVDGLAPAGAALIIITPLMLVPLNLIDVYTAFYAAIVICMLLLFLLGLFLGRVSRKSMWSYGAKTLLAGIVTAILMYIISHFTGAGA
ncbi:MAG: VIT1/CCC1 transporter family protein [Candidatus Sifarchaeia archaeon]